MENNNESYLINKLNNGEKLNIVFMSHNAHWPQVEVLSECYENCKVQTFGSGFSYIELAIMTNSFYPIDDIDLIIYYANARGFHDYDYIKMKKFAHDISKEKEKPITVAYSFYNPDYVATDYHQEHVIKLVSINNDIEIEDEITVLNLQPIDLVNYTLIKHDNVNNKKSSDKSEDNIYSFFGLAMSLAITDENFFMFGNKNHMDYHFSIAMAIDELIDNGYTKEEIKNLIMKFEFTTINQSLTEEEIDDLRKYSLEILDIKYESYLEQINEENNIKKLEKSKM